MEDNYLCEWWYICHRREVNRQSDRKKSKKEEEEVNWEGRKKDPHTGSREEG